jgi:hypothetical protein
MTTMEPENITVGQLLYRMKPAHLWCVCAGICTLIVAAAGIAYKAQTVVHEGIINSMQFRIDVLQHALISSSTPHTANVTTSDTESVKYPGVANPLSPTMPEVAALADFYELTRKRIVNPHLVYGPNDVLVWHQQRLTEGHLCMEFDSRRLVLEAADRDGRPIPTQGDLSFAAGLVQRGLRIR